ncbi:MAG: thermonuclease family protein [Rubrivivax sp.]
MNRLAPHLLAAMLCTLVLAGASPPAEAQARNRPAQGQQGLVVAVTDGDTLTLRLPDGQPVTVRLRDIDAPEICQPWGPEAKAALSELALNKLAILTPSSRDSYGRVVGRVTVEELDLGRRLVEEGHAWSTRTQYDRGPLVKQERMAKALGRGLHAQVPSAIPPWAWRREKGLCPKP